MVPGRAGGLKGGPARAAKMTPEERSESARNAVNARWARMTAEERRDYARYIRRAGTRKKKTGL